MVVLETERLLLRDPQPEDLEPFWAMEADPEVRRFIGGKPRTREQAEERFRRDLQRTNKRLPFVSIIDKPENHYAGRSGLHPGNTASVPVLEKLGFHWVSFEQGERRSFDNFQLLNPTLTP